VVVFFHYIVGCTPSYGARAYIDISTTIDTTSSPDINDLKLKRGVLELRRGVVVDDLTRQPPRVAGARLQLLGQRGHVLAWHRFRLVATFPHGRPVRRVTIGAALVLLHFVLLLYTLFSALASLKIASES
jgi:hypothetical protein